MCLLRTMGKDFGDLSYMVLTDCAKAAGGVFLEHIIFKVQNAFPVIIDMRGEVTVGDDQASDDKLQD